MAKNQQSPSPTADDTSAAVRIDMGLGFLGNHPLNLDEKLRLIVPARFKAIMQEKYAMGAGAITLVMTISLDRHYRNASAYPLPDWQKYIAKLEQMPVLDRNSQQLHRLVTSLATPVEMDGQGRIRLDKKIAEVARLEKRVVVIGRGSHFEIWDEKRFDQFIEDTISHADTMADNAMARMGAPAGVAGPMTQ